MILDDDNTVIDKTKNPELTIDMLKSLGWEKCTVHSSESEFFVNTTLFNSFWYSGTNYTNKRIFVGIYYVVDAFYLVWRESLNVVPHTVKVTNINSLKHWTEFLLNHQNQLHK